MSYNPVILDPSRYDNPKPEDKPGLMSDIGYGVTSAANSGLAGMARTIDTIIGDGTDGEFIKRLDQNAEYGQQQLSDKQQQANQKQFITEDKNGYGIGDAFTDPRAYVGLATNVVGGQLPILPVGGVLGGALKAGLSKFIASNAVKNIAGAAGFKAGLSKFTASNAVEDIAGAAGFAAAESLMVTGGVKGDVYKAVIAMPDEIISQSPFFQKNYWDKVDNGMDKNQAFDESRQDLAEESSLRAMKDVAIPSAILGAPGGIFLSKLFSNTLKGSRGSRALQGIIAEGPSEGAQGATEQYIQQSELAKIDKSIDPKKNLLDTFFKEGLGAGALGGVMGGLSRTKDVKPDNTDQNSDTTPDNTDQNSDTTQNKDNIDIKPGNDLLNKKYTDIAKGLPEKTKKLKLKLNELLKRGDIEKAYALINKQKELDIAASRYDGEFNTLKGVTTGLKEKTARIKNNLEKINKRKELEKYSERGGGKLRNTQLSDQLSNLYKVIDHIEKPDIAKGLPEKTKKLNDTKTTSTTDLFNRAGRANEPGIDQDASGDNATKVKGNKKVNPEPSTGVEAGLGGQQTDSITDLGFTPTHTDVNDELVQKIGENLYVNKDGLEIEDNYATPISKQANKESDKSREQKSTENTGTKLIDSANLEPTSVQDNLAVQNELKNEQKNKAEKKNTGTQESEKTGEPDTTPDKNSVLLDKELSTDKISKVKGGKIIYGVPILDQSDKVYINAQLKSEGIKSKSPGFKDAKARITDQYEKDLERAEFSLPFNEYKKLSGNEKVSDETLKDTYNSIRKELGISGVINVNDTESISDKQGVVKASKINGADKTYHPAIESYINDLVEGGGITVDKDGRRNPTLNPEWYANNNLQVKRIDGSGYLNTSPKVRDIWKAFKDYSEGKTLKKSQSNILDAISEQAQDDEDFSNEQFNAEQIAFAKELTKLINNGKNTEVAPFIESAINGNRITSYDDIVEFQKDIDDVKQEANKRRIQLHKEEDALSSYTEEELEQQDNKRKSTAKQKLDLDKKATIEKVEKAKDESVLSNKGSDTISNGVVASDSEAKQKVPDKEKLTAVNKKVKRLLSGINVTLKYQDENGNVISVKSNALKGMMKIDEELDILYALKKCMA